MLEGLAGSRTTCTAMLTLTRLASHGVPCLAVSLDWIPDEERSAQATGQRLGLTTSPAVLHGEIAGGRPFVLCSDQLGAVSVVSACLQSVRGRAAS